MCFIQNNRRRRERQWPTVVIIVVRSYKKHKNIGRRKILRLFYSFTLREEVRRCRLIISRRFHENILNLNKSSVAKMKIIQFLYCNMFRLPTNKNADMIYVFFPCLCRKLILCCRITKSGMFFLVFFVDICYAERNRQFLNT
jgi:hypothetical protein